MFNWLLQKRRRIFRFWDGSRWRAVDPLRAWRLLWNHPTCSPEKDFGPATGAHPDKFEPDAQDRVLGMIQDMFGVKPWSEDTPGLTIDETLNLLWDFIRYMNDLKKKPNTTPTMSAPTESESCKEDSTTPCMSDSFSTKNECNDDAPLSSSRQSVRL